MKHLIKQYYPFFGEAIHPEKVFTFPFNCFYQSYNLTNFILSPEFPIPERANTKAISVGFFSVHKHLKIN